MKWFFMNHAPVEAMSETTTPRPYFLNKIYIKDNIYIPNDAGADQRRNNYKKRAR